MAKTNDLTGEQETMLLIRGTISTLDPAMRMAFQMAYDSIRALGKLYGEDAVAIAVALRGAEIVAGL